MSGEKRDAVVEALEGGGAYVSGKTIARSLGISRAAVWKHVVALRASGYTIETARARGYRLVAKPDRLTIPAVRARLVTRYLGAELRCVPLTGSTNSDVAEHFCPLWLNALCSTFLMA